MKRLILVALVTLSRPAAAQEAPRDTARLADIIVTATRLPIPRANLASSVTVIPGELLRAQGIRTVSDALRSIPGASLAQNGSFGAVTSLFLRGGESDYVQVLVDGVALNGPGGTFNFASLTTDNVERIEVVAGPASVLYGSDAVAGVVQIFTRQGRGPATVDAGLRAGTFGTLASDAGIQGSSQNLDYTFAVSRFSSDGSFAYNNQHQNSIASGRFHVTPDARTDATFTLRYTDNVFHYPTDGAGRLVDANQFTFGSGTALALDAGRRVTNRVEVRVLVASNETDDGSDDQSDTAADTLGFYASKSLNHSRRRSGDLRTNIYLGSPGIMTVGARIESQATRGMSASQSAFGPSSSSSDYARYDRAGYVQALLEPAPRLSLTLGGRVDDNEKFGTYGTYRAGFSFRPVAGARFRGSVGTGFKEPTFFENFDTGFSRGNPALKPEHSASWEVGVEHTHRDRLRIGAVYFSQRFRDLIQYTFAPVDPAGPNYYNVAAANASGVEVTAHLSIAGFTADGSYTNLKSSVLDAGFDTGPAANFVEGKRLLRRPTHLLSFHVARDLAGHGSATVGVRHVGDRDDLDFSSFPFTRPTLPAYTVFDATGEVILHKLQPRVTATLRVENLAAVQYAEIFGFPARGRTIVAGGRVAF